MAMRRGHIWVLCALVVMAWGGLSGAKAAQEVKIYTFSASAVPVELLQTAMQVSDKDVTFTLTFAGDCTLGGPKATADWEKSFANLVGERGMAYPFEKVSPLFQTDDLTVVNLEGVLSDGELDKQEGKQYNFIGSAEYTEILRQGSVECVNLANNHTRDYGEQGYQDTLQALDGAGVAHFGEDTVTVLEKDGIRIGFTANVFTLSDGSKERLDQQWAALRSVGCQWIAHTLHAGVEYDDRPSGKQRSMAEYVAGKGVGLVVGHHPHVVQGIELMRDTPVLYSLGNCSFGGNLRPRDYAACVLRAELRFVGGEKQDLVLTLHPIRISGEKRYNDYRPVLLAGEEARRVIERMQDSSAVELAPFVEGKGAVQPKITYDPKEGEKSLWQIPREKSRKR